MSETLESLKQKAIDKTGLTDFGKDTYSAPLGAWIEDLNGPNPNERGRKFYSGLAVNDLARRLEVMDCLKQNPEIDDVVIPPIIYITGHERSGTTLLHNLLSLDENARSLKRWELMRPTPPPEAATYFTDPRIAMVQAPQEKLRGTLLEHMHWVDADDPEECTWGLLNCTGVLGQSPVGAMPTWAAWLTTADMTDTLLEYRRLIKLLLWRNPVHESGYLVLKAPQHAGLVDVLAQVFPEAHYVFTHRDPYRTFTSVCSLAGHTNESFVNNSEMFKPGGKGIDLFLDRCETKLAAMVTHEKSLSSQITNVAYPELVKDPYTAIQPIYQQAGRSTPANLERLVSEYLAEQQAGRRAKPLTEIPSFGFDHDQFLLRPKSADYCQHFHVQPERKRATGA